MVERRTREGAVAEEEGGEAPVTAVAVAAAVAVVAVDAVVETGTVEW